MTPEEVQSHLSDLADIVRASSGKEPKPGKLGKYRIDELLGSGGQSVLLRGHDPDLQRDVALKLHHSMTDELREEVLREGRTLAKIESPFVARCHTVETFADSPCLVLEYIAGVSLSDQIRQAEFTERKAATIIAQLAEGLAAVHDRGVFHRDLKPANIIVSPDGKPTIIDFGLACSGDVSIGSTSGTACYMPPERAQGASIADVPGDVFGLGAILYEMLTGRPPFVADSKQLSLERAAKCELVRPLPNPRHAISKLCMKCLDPDPSKRYRSAYEVADAAKKIASAPSAGLKWVAVAAAAMLCLAAAFAYTGLANPPATPIVVNDFVPNDIVWVDASCQLDQPSDGSQETPFRTIAEALRSTHPNSVIRIRGYNKRGQIEYREQKLSLQRDQHEGVHLTNWGVSNPDADTGTPKFLPLLVLADSSAGVCTLQIGANDTQLSKLAFSGNADQTVVVSSGSADRIQNVDIGFVKFDDCNVAMLFRKADGLRLHDIQINDCAIDYRYTESIGVYQVTDAKLTNVSISHQGDRSIGMGIYIEDSSRVSVAQCRFLDIPNKAIFTKRVHDLQIANNLVLRCRGGFWLCGNEVTSSARVHGNVLSATANAIVARPLPEGVSLILNDLRITHNTIYDCSQKGIYVEATSAKENVVCHNVLVECAETGLLVRESEDAISMTVAYNVIESYEWEHKNNLLVPRQNDMPLPQLLIQKRLSEGDKCSPTDLKNYALLPTSVGSNLRREHGPFTDRNDSLDTPRSRQAPDMGAIETP